MRSERSRKIRLIRSAFSLVLVIFVVCMLIVVRKQSGIAMEWHDYLDVLFLFLAAFMRMMSLLFQKTLVTVSKRFNILALIFIILALFGYLTDWFITR